MQMLYIMLGIIIFQLTFVAIGSTATAEERHAVGIMGLVINVLLLVVLGVVYVVFFKSVH